MRTTSGSFHATSRPVSTLNHSIHRDPGALRELGHELLFLKKVDDAREDAKKNHHEQDVLEYRLP